MKKQLLLIPFLFFVACKSIDELDEDDDKVGKLNPVEIEELKKFSTAVSRSFVIASEYEFLILTSYNRLPSEIVTAIEKCVKTGTNLDQKTGGNFCPVRASWKIDVISSDIYSLDFDFKISDRNFQHMYPYHSLKATGRRNYSGSLGTSLLDSNIEGSVKLSHGQDIEFESTFQGPPTGIYNIKYKFEARLMNGKKIEATLSDPKVGYINGREVLVEEFLMHVPIIR